MNLPRRRQDLKLRKLVVFKMILRKSRRFCSISLLIASILVYYKDNLAVGASSFMNEDQASDSNNSNVMPTNFYMNSQASKFRVNVSNICEKNSMKVSIRLNKPFYGLIHTKDKRKKEACFLNGNGDQFYSLAISYTLVQSDPFYCGVVSHHLNQSANRSTNHQTAETTLSVVLVVRLHKTIEFSDDRYFLLSCAK